MAFFSTKSWWKCKYNFLFDLSDSFTFTSKCATGDKFLRVFSHLQLLNSLQFKLRYFSYVRVLITPLICFFTRSDPTYFTLTRIHQNVYGDVNLRMQNLDTLVKHLKGYYQVRVECCKEMKIKISLLLEKRKRASKRICTARKFSPRWCISLADVCVQRNRRFIIELGTQFCFSVTFVRVLAASLFKTGIFIFRRRFSWFMKRSRA